MKQHPLFPFIVLLACVFTSSASPVDAQTLTFQQRFSGTSQSFFGGRIDIDGEFLVIGAIGNQVVTPYLGERGSVYVYRRSASGTSWTLQQRLQASDGRDRDHFGVDVAISGDTIVVGSGRDAAYVFVWNGTTWTEQSKLTASDATEGNFFGQDVDIDGSVIVVGARLADRVIVNYNVITSGAAYVYERSGTGWSEQKLTPPSPDRRHFGASVAVSGNTMCVGMVDANELGLNPRGNAYVYDRGGFWRLQAELVAPDLGARDRYGNVCAVEDDTVVVGADLADAPATDQGAAYVFTRSGEAWPLQQKLTSAGSRTRDYMGNRIALAGNWLALGAPTNNAPGGVFLFERTGATWTARQRVQPNMGSGSDGAGIGVALDSRHLAIGSPTLTEVVIYSRGSVTGTPPGTPRNFAATASGNTVSMSWQHPTSGGSPTGYVLHARTTAGALIVTAPIGLTTSFSAAAPNGVYVLTVQATNPAGAGQESTPRTVTVPTVTPPPGNPTNLTVSVAGDAATFTWSAPTSGGPATGYLLSAGTTPSFGVPLAVLPLPAAPTSVTVPGVPIGTFHVRVLAQNAGGIGGPSNEGSVSVAPLAPPGMPTMHPATVSGSTVVLSWSPGPGGAPASYTLAASMSPGGAPLTAIPVTGTSLTVPGVPPGTYYVQLVAQNAAGTSPPSSAVAVVVR